jgi:hypothetical protein
VDQDSLGGFWFGVLAGSFDESAVDEGRPSADQGYEVGCVDGAPAGSAPDQAPLFPAEIPGQFGQRILHASQPRPPGRSDAAR